MAMRSNVLRLTWLAAFLVVFGTSLAEARRLKENVIVTKIGDGIFKSNPDIVAPPPGVDTAESILASILAREKSLIEREEAIVRDRNSNDRRLLADGEQSGSFVSTSGSASTSSSFKTSVSVDPTTFTTSGSTHTYQSRSVVGNPHAGTTNPRLYTGKNIIPGAGVGNPRQNTNYDGAGDVEEEDTLLLLHSGAGMTNPRLSTTIIPGAGVDNPRVNTGSLFGNGGSEEESSVDVLHSGDASGEESTEVVQHIVPGAGTGNPRFQIGSFGQRTGGVVESEGDRLHLFVDDAENPASVGGTAKSSGFSGSGVSLDLSVSSSSNGRTFSAGSKTTGTDSAFSGVGLSVNGGDDEHLTVPVPVTSEQYP